MIEAAAVRPERSSTCAVAGTHLAQEGAAALCLRSIARDLGMAPSALYRYFDGRDAPLSELIVAAYTSLADEAERVARYRSGSAGNGEPYLNPRVLQEGQFVL